MQAYQLKMNRVVLLLGNSTHSGVGGEGKLGE